MTEFKDKAGSDKEASVDMAADILLYKATHVLLEADQKQLRNRVLHKI